VCVLSFIFSCKKRETESKHCLLARSRAFAASLSLPHYYQHTSRLLLLIMIILGLILEFSLKKYQMIMSIFFEMIFRKFVYLYSSTEREGKRYDGASFVLFIFK
jgi:hypothetical protein